MMTVVSLQLRFVPMRAQLIPVDGGAPVDLVKDLTVVGRKEDCDLRLDHKSISKQHCIIVKTDGLLLIRDLGSTNATYINGMRLVNPHRVMHGEPYSLREFFALRQCVMRLDREAHFALFHGFFLPAAAPCLEIANRKDRLRPFINSMEAA